MTTQDEFVQLLTKYNGNMEINTSTKLKMNKGGRAGVEPNPFYDRDVRKVKTSVYEVGGNYREKIAEALIAEGQSMEHRDDFTNDLPWGEYEIKDKVVKYNGKRYLRCYPIKNEEVEEEIVVDGKKPDEKDLKTIMSYVPDKSGSSKKQESAGITEEHQVRPLLFAFDSINYVVFNGVKYDIE